MWLFAVATSILLGLTSWAAAADNEQPPNIVFVLADDMGWNDVGFHGSAQIPTPNLDALAYTGLILNNYYVTPLCTPSRSALMTGKHPIHTGMQHRVLYAAEPRGLPLSERLLPEHLRRLGYATHAVGKWHLGHWRQVYTPQQRGFDTHLGFWTGHQDYFDHRADDVGRLGFDMRRGMAEAYDLNGQYTTDVLGRESVRIIAEHNRTRPLFLYMAQAAVHSGNPYDPLPVPQQTVDQLASKVADPKRRRFAAMMVHMDRSVGRVVEALQERDMLENTLIVFSTDNGGAAAGFNLNAASNWPLRGVKNTLWEGGVRGAALLWSPKLVGAGAGGGRVAEQRMHIMDWMPTLYRAAGGNVGDLGPDLDAHDVWDALRDNKPSQRTEVLHNIDDITGFAALTVDNFKVLVGTSYHGQWDHWYGPAGNRTAAAYNVSAVLESPVGKALASLRRLPTVEHIETIRAAASVECQPHDEVDVKTDCHPLKEPCLYDIAADPCEQHNLAAQQPEVLQRLLQRLAQWNATAVPPGNLQLDPRGYPNNWNGSWTNFGDYV